jgi:fumarate hydratase class II
MSFREEKDTMGTVKVPSEAYWGAQTQRARENFPISDLRFPPLFLHTLALVKQLAAQTNRELALLEEKFAEVIIRAAQEVLDGRFDDQFDLDIFQTGSGTSTNMNMNEVIATRANELLTGEKNVKAPVHPNDHVNLGQSSNDVIPTVIHVSALLGFERELKPALALLHKTLLNKCEEFADIYKIGRTHLQDAVEMTLGQEFSGYARQVELGLARIDALQPRLAEVALGGTAIGTGLNAHPQFAQNVVARLVAETGLPLTVAANHFEAQAARDAALEASAMLKTIATSMVKIADDIRWLSSGPRCGIGEIQLPQLQPGSSIMPGKINPVIPEAVIQVAAQVVGNDAAITMGAQRGNFELNVMLPVIAFNLLQSITLLASAATVFSKKCIAGIAANRDACSRYIDRSLATVTALVPHIGYDRAAALARKAFETDRTVRAVAEKEADLPESLLKEIFKHTESS